MGLGAATEQIHKMETQRPAKGVSICPGPNMAYFSNIMSLKEITDHIYGRMNQLGQGKRPHMFLKELKLYADHLKSKLEETQGDLNKKQEKYLLSFAKNMKEGINYYQDLFSETKNRFQNSKSNTLFELEKHLKNCERIEKRIKSLITVQVKA